jgi:hypothetical protein
MTLQNVRWPEAAASLSCVLLGAIGLRAVVSPLHIVWDLDAVLIASHHPLAEAQAKFPPDEFPDSFDQIDDDFPIEAQKPNTRTWWRPGAKLLVHLLRPFAIQYVFTSAQGSYCQNVVSQLDPSGRVFKRVVHRDMFPPNHLRQGKDIRMLFGAVSHAAAENAAVGDAARRRFARVAHRAVLFDDQLRYHRSQPENGVLVRPFEDVRGEGRCGYGAALGMGWVALRAFCARDARAVLRRYRSPDFNQEYGLCFSPSV